MRAHREVETGEHPAVTAYLILSLLMVAVGVVQHLRALPRESPVAPVAADPVVQVTLAALVRAAKEIPGALLIQVAHQAIRQLVAAANLHLDLAMPALTSMAVQAALARRLPSQGQR